MNAPRQETPLDIAALLAELRGLDIRLWLDDGRLRCDAPPGVLTPELRERLSAHKPALIGFLQGADILARQQPAIVPLQPRGSRPPLFFASGHNGDPYALRILARCLGTEQPFYGLQPPGTDGRGEPLETVEELGDYFAAQIRSFHPEGPYLLAGLCAGGTVVYEVAQRLRRAGAPVALLALIASPHPHELRPLPTLRRSLAEQWAKVRRHASALGGPLPESFRHLAGIVSRHRAHRAEARRRGADPILAQRARVAEAILTALSRYRPAPYPGPVHLFLPGEEWMAPGGLAARWRGMAERMTEHYGPAGSNNNDILGEIHGPAFAEIFRPCLDLGEQPGEPAPARPEPEASGYWAGELSARAG